MPDIMKKWRESKIRALWAESKLRAVWHTVPIAKNIWHLRTIWNRPEWSVKYLVPTHLWIDKVDVVVTTKCNLLCPGCSHLMPYYQKSYHVNKEELIAAMRKLNESFDYCDHYNILGGEPFLNPNLKYFLEEAPSEKCHLVQVLTNATIVPKDQELLDVMRRKQIHVVISPYPSNEQSQKRLIEILEKNEIPYNLYNRPWTDYGAPTDHGNSEKNVRKQFCRCDEVCKNLLNGKLYYCFRSSHCDDLGLIKADKGSYVDLLNNTREQNRREIRRLMWRHRPVEACRYCLKGTFENREIIRGV